MSNFLTLTGICVDNQNHKIYIGTQCDFIVSWNPNDFPPEATLGQSGQVTDKTVYYQQFFVQNVDTQKTNTSHSMRNYMVNNDDYKPQTDPDSPEHIPNGFKAGDKVKIGTWFQNMRQEVAYTFYSDVYTLVDRPKPDAPSSCMTSPEGTAKYGTNVTVTWSSVKDSIGFPTDEYVLGCNAVKLSDGGTDKLTLYTGKNLSYVYSVPVDKYSHLTFNVFARVSGMASKSYRYAKTLKVINTKNPPTDPENIQVNISKA